MIALIVLLGALATAFLARRLSSAERRYVGILFVAHVIGAYANVWLYEDYYGYGDINHYTRYGRLIAQLLDVDFVRFAPDVGRVILHLDNHLPFGEIGDAESTGTLCAYTGIVMFLIGPSKLGACIVFSLGAMFGQLALYSVVRAVITERERFAAAVGTLLVPSVVFWSSAIQKEAVALAGLGMLCRGAFMLSRRQSLAAGAIVTALGAVVVGTIKPYILFPFVLAVGAWVFSARTQGTRFTTAHIAYGVAGLVIAVGGLFLLGRVFPRFSFESLGETASHLQDAGARTQTTGDSYLAVGDASEKSLAGQARYVPLALLNALFRPLVFDVRGPVVLAAAVEMTGVTALMAIVINRFRGSSARAIMWRSPILVFSAAFVLLFSAGVGIATTNMGTLSRYRMPMMPFYVTALLLVYRRTSPGSDDAAAETAPDDTDSLVVDED